MCVRVRGEGWGWGRLVRGVERKWWVGRGGCVSGRRVVVVNGVVCVCVRVCEIGRRRKAEVAMKRRG